MKKINLRIANWAIVITALILVVGLTNTFIRVSGRFNLPLTWILTPSSGASISFQNAIKAVDGIDSGINADLLDNFNSTDFLGAACPSDMVKVGSFCIDKYEASYSGCDTTGNGYCDFNSVIGDSNLGEPGNKSVYTDTYPAISVSGYKPITCLTWFQAAAMCADAGKRLCTNQEWQIAALGTHDPGSNDADNGENTMCNTSGGNARKTGLAGSTPAGSDSCISQYGVEDMAGNVWEWVADWVDPWNTDATYLQNETYGSDYVWRESKPLIGDNGGYLLAAVMRGGPWDNGPRPGVFALGLTYAPSNWGNAVGFRCCK